VPQECELQLPQPDLVLLLMLVVPCPTSGVLPPASIKAFQMRLALTLPQAAHAGSLLSVIERSIVKVSLQS